MWGHNSDWRPFSLTRNSFEIWPRQNHLITWSEVVDKIYERRVLFALPVVIGGQLFGDDCLCTFYVYISTLMQSWIASRWCGWNKPACMKEGRNLGSTILYHRHENLHLFHLIHLFWEWFWSFLRSVQKTNTNFEHHVRGGVILAVGN